MVIVSTIDLPDAAVAFLKFAYKFVNVDWHHIDHKEGPDFGFEQLFRGKCTIELREWNISQNREMHLGLNLNTTSGVLHEVDIVAHHARVFAVAELKNRLSFPPDKNDAIVFFAKMVDYLSLHSYLLDKEVLPVFMSVYDFEDTGLAACLGLGIHPIGPNIRPLPIIIENVRKMLRVVGAMPLALADTTAELDDLAADVSYLSQELESVWFPARFGSGTGGTLIVHPVEPLQTLALATRMRKVNADCTKLLPIIQRLDAELKASSGPT